MVKLRNGRLALCCAHVYQRLTQYVRKFLLQRGRNKSAALSLIRKRRRDGALKVVRQVMEKRKTAILKGERKQ